MATPVERTVRSFQKVTDFPFCTATYYADYRLEQFTARTRTLEDIPSFFDSLYRDAGYPADTTLKGTQRDTLGCSAFAARTSGGNRIVGKNLDWRKGPILLLRTIPAAGYSSLSVVDLSLCDLFSTGSTIHSLLTAPYVPFDGMNEHGLVVSMLSVASNTPYPKPTGKVPVGDFNAIRIILDRCATIDEAIDVFNEFDIVQSGPLPIHFLLSDPGGSCVVELFGDAIHTERTAESSVVTNALKMCGTDGGSENCSRYRTMEAYLERQSGIVELEEAKRLLNDVSVFTPGYALPSTIWSLVFSPDERCLRIRPGDSASYYRVGLARG